MTNLAAFTIEGSVGGVSLSSDLGFDAVHEETLAFRLEGSAALVGSFAIQVYDPAVSGSPQATKDAPALVLTGATTGQAVLASTPASDITTAMPDDGIHTWIVRALVDGGLDRDGNPDPTRVFERMVAIRTGGGLRKIVATESTQYQPEGWAEAVNEMLELDGGGGVSLSDAAPANLSLTTAAAGNGASASRSNHVHTFPSQDANTVLANVTTGSSQPTAAAPQALIFTNTTSGAGNARCKVAPVGYSAVSVANGANQNHDYDPGENGRFTFLVKLSLANTGSNFAKSYEVEAVRVGGTLTLIGSAVPGSAGDMTGITVTISASSGSLRVNIANATGTTLAGRAHFSVFIEDAL